MLSTGEQSRLLKAAASDLSLSVDEFKAVLAYRWEGWQARPEQVEPAGVWTYWVILAGRGFGKTRSGGEWVRKRAVSGRFREINLIAATADDARDIMVEGESGILAICPPWERPSYFPSKRRLEWPNGCKSLIFTADEPERFRGKQHESVWADEVAAWRYPESWDQAMLGLRIGPDPRAVVTTTPRPAKLIRELLGNPATVVTRGTTYDNRENLAPPFFETIIRKYEGTRLGRQELEAELLDDIPGALWSRKLLDELRVKKTPLDLYRIVVGVDPMAAADEETGLSETGIVTCGVGRDDQHGYVLADHSVRGGPADWARQAVSAYYQFEADVIVAEKNNGGDMVRHTIHSVDRNVPVELVHASRGKRTRAEPVAMLYEQGRIHHVGLFDRLEDQMCEWTPDPPAGESRADSPDRMDALVWALTKLMVTGGEVRGYSKLDWAEDPVVARGDLILRGERYIDKVYD